MKTLVIGASENKSRFSNQAIRLLKSYNHEVVALGRRTGNINDTEIITEPLNFKGIHTVSLYVSPKNQIEYYQYIISLKPQRIIFNPGTENHNLSELAKENNIEVIEDCTLVMLTSNEF